MREKTSYGTVAIVGLIGTLTLAGIYPKVEAKISNVFQDIEAKVKNTYLDVKSGILKRQAYEIADRDKRKGLDMRESSQLARDLGLIAKSEVISLRGIEDKVKANTPEQNIAIFSQYIDSHKENN
jgi:hypothetical protein